MVLRSCRSCRHRKSTGTPYAGCPPAGYRKKSLKKQHWQGSETALSYGTCPHNAAWQGDIIRKSLSPLCSSSPKNGTAVLPQLSTQKINWHPVCRLPCWLSKKKPQKTALARQRNGTELRYLTPQCCMAGGHNQKIPFATLLKQPEECYCGSGTIGQQAAACCCQQQDQTTLRTDAPRRVQR